MPVFGTGEPCWRLQFDPGNLGRAFEDAHSLGATYAVSSIMRSLVNGPNPANSGIKTGMTRDEAKRTAELANRIGDSVERPLSPADHQNPAALQPPAARRLACGFQAELADITYLVGHLSSHRV